MTTKAVPGYRTPKASPVDIALHKLVAKSSSSFLRKCLQISGFKKNLPRIVSFPQLMVIKEWKL
jgi:hypothetical protein